MRHARNLRTLGGLAVLCAGLPIAGGCTHNDSYGANPCAPTSTAVGPGAVQYGSVCDVPAESNSVVNAVTKPLLGANRPPRVVVSEPDGGRPRYTWRAADPDGMITTRVEGNVDDPTVVR